MDGAQSGFEEPDGRETFEQVSRDVFEDDLVTGGIVIEGMNDPPSPPPGDMRTPMYCRRRSKWIDATRHGAVLYLPELTAADLDFSHWLVDQPEA
ncbi:MAG: hypothetical protein GVY12_01045 [Bacteroidetes bacterium]|jgi:hypothetical protein|nr:hypothetical protein [Bacteroidota bacterium]